MQKKASTKRVIKHQPGTSNKILIKEEVLLAFIDKALSSTTNSQTVGLNGEIPLRDFLNKYLPYTLRAATGHFVPPSGQVSPQIDVMILDSRYPLLSENADGSVLAMLHSVVGTMEVKTRITTSDIPKLWKNYATIMSLASEVEGYGNQRIGSIFSWAFAYRSKNRLDTLAERYFDAGTPEFGLDLILLRLPDKDQMRPEKIGLLFHFEPNFESDECREVVGYDPILIPQFTPLSDLYYRLVQDSYYCLANRGYEFHDIGMHIMKYMSWSTCPA
ncbi:MAG: DUF6602 domain-containing protein [Candidatus Scalinduaceae bacterium]